MTERQSNVVHLCDHPKPFETTGKPWRKMTAVVIIILLFCGITTKAFASKMEWQGIDACSREVKKIFSYWSGNDSLDEYKSKGISSSDITPTPTPIDERIAHAENIMKSILDTRENLDNLTAVILVPEYTEDDEGQITLKGLKQENSITYDFAQNIKTEYRLTNLQDDIIYIDKKKIIENIKLTIKQSGGNVTPEKNRDKTIIGFELKGVNDWETLPNTLLNGFEDLESNAYSQDVSTRSSEDVQSKLKDILPRKGKDNNQEFSYILFLFKTGRAGLYEAMIIDDRGNDIPKSRYYIDMDTDIITIDRKELEYRLKGKRNENELGLEPGKESIANYYFWFGKPLLSTFDTDNNSLIKEFAESLVDAVLMEP